MFNLANQTRGAITVLFGAATSATFITPSSPAWTRYTVMAGIAGSVLWLTAILVYFLTSDTEPASSSDRDGEVR